MDVATTPRFWSRIVLSSLLALACAVAVYLRPPAEPRYVMVDELVARAGELDGDRLRVHGWVRPGSIVRLSPQLTTFVVQRRGMGVRVWHAGPVPDTFKDDSELVVVGTFEGNLYSDRLLAKCATKYDGGRPRDFTTVYK